MEVSSFSIVNSNVSSCLLIAKQNNLILYNRVGKKIGRITPFMQKKSNAVSYLFEKYN